MEPENDDVDPSWMSVSKFRCYWNERWSGHYGSFEDTSEFSVSLLYLIAFLVKQSLYCSFLDNGRILRQISIRA
jgi:hypothetical protein